MTTRKIELKYTATVDGTNPGPPLVGDVVATGDIIGADVYLQIVVKPGSKPPATRYRQWKVAEAIRQVMFNMVEEIFPAGMEVMTRADGLRDVLSESGMPYEDIEFALDAMFKTHGKMFKDLDDLIREVIGGETEEESWLEERLKGFAEVIRKSRQGTPEEKGDLTAEGVGETSKDSAQGDLIPQAEGQPQGGSAEAEGPASAGA